MLNLVTTTDKITLNTSSTADIDVNASFVERTSSGDTHKRTSTSIGSIATTDIVLVPGASSTYRNVRELTITNRHASTNCTIIVAHTDGTNSIQLYTAVLQPGWVVKFNGRWELFDAGAIAVLTALAGIWLGRRTLTAASGTHITGPQCTAFTIRGVAGGAGGGGSTSVTNGRAACGGGGSGGYAEKYFSAQTPSTSCTFTCGALGAGSSGAAGGNGGDSTFVVGGTTVTAKGGTGGAQCVAVAAASSFAGGAGGVAGTNGDINAGGAPGRCGHVTVSSTTGPGVSGAGGNSRMGVGGAPLATGGNGNNAIGFGAGGGGSCNFTSATVRTGGNGTAGCWVVDEYS